MAMARSIKLNFRVSEELKDKMDKEIERLGTDMAKWLNSVVQKSLEEKIVVQSRGGREEVANPVRVTQADIQRQLDELYKRKKVLGNGVEMPGTYVDIYNLGEGELLSKPGVEGVEE